MPGLHAVALQTACSVGGLDVEFINRTQDLTLVILEFWFFTQQATFCTPYTPPPFLLPWEETNEFKTTVASLAPAPSTQPLTGGVLGGAAARRPCVHLVISLLCCITVFTPPPHTHTPSPPSPAESSPINILHLPNELCQLELCAWLPACLVTFYCVECVWWGT